CRGKSDTLRSLLNPVAHPRAAHRNRTDAGHYLALGLMAVAHQTAPAISPELVGIPREQRGHFGFNRLRQQRSCAAAQHLGQRVGKSNWLGELQNGSVIHGVSSFDGEWRNQAPPRYATSSFHAVTNFRA